MGTTEFQSKYKMSHIDVEGLILPNKALSNFDLDEAAKKLKIKHFRGTFVRDKLPSKPKARECGILNTGDSSTGGHHWMCWFKTGKTKLSFDSYGLAPPIKLVAYLKNPVYYNSERVQYAGIDKVDIGGDSMHHIIIYHQW